MMIFPLNIPSFFGAPDITGLSNPEPESDCEAWEDMAFSAWPMPKIQGISWGFHGDLLVIYWVFSGIFLGCSGIEWQSIGIYQGFNGISW
jgi:hypothetical protein